MKILVAPARSRRHNHVMRYQMRQKLFSFGDDYTIKDDSGNDRFFVDGKALSIGDKLSFQDMQGNELAYIRQKLLSIGATYEIYRNDQLAAVVKKQIFTLLRAKFSVDVPGPDDLEASGDFLAHEYEFTKGGETVATVSKAWFAMTDSYGVDIAANQDDVLILACTVVIDLCCHPDQKHH